MNSIDNTDAETDSFPNKYTYQSIDLKDEIRILILQPPASPDAAELHCEIATAKLSDNPIYEAISYCWGAEMFTETLHLPADCTLAITDNLTAGSRRTRLKDRPRRLWVDAVCINQCDDMEKSHQVSLMAQIYKNSECVLVSLGESNEAIDTGIEIIRKLADSAWKHGLKYDDHLLQRIEDFASRMNGLENGIGAALTRLSSEVDVQSLNSFVSQDWFTRLWIVQEYVLASKVRILDGRDILSHEELCLAIAVLAILSTIRSGFTSLSVVVNGDSFSNTWTTIMERLSYKSHIGRNLLTLLDSHSNRKCKLDQDRIYGLLALTPAGLSVAIEINYHLDTEELYKRLALVYLRGGNLDI